MGRNTNAKGRRVHGSFIQLPHRVLDSENFLALTPKAVKLLIDTSAQYRGHNNGDLCATFSMMSKRGWRSKQQLQDALEELLHYGFLMLTRQGGRHKPSLYAITWQPIDECKGKLEVAATNKAPGNWIKPQPAFVPKRLRQIRNGAPHIGPMCPAYRVN